MHLDKVTKGQKVKILLIPDNSVRAQAIRFGISENEVVHISEIIMGGPIVLEKGKQEIAIGRKLAKTIEVELIAKNYNPYATAKVNV